MTHTARNDIVEFVQPLWCITITHRDGLKPYEAVIKRFFGKFQTGVAVMEDHASGKLHLHAMVYRDTQRANKITVMLQRYFDSNDIEYGPNTFKVRRCTVPVGWLHYLRKTSNEWFWLAGFKDTWLRAQKINLKKVPHKMLMDDYYSVTASMFTPLVLEYAKQHNCEILVQLDVMNVCKSMMREGFQFGAIYNKLRGLTACLLASIGSDAADRELESAFGIDHWVG